MVITAKFAGLGANMSSNLAVTTNGVGVPAVSPTSVSKSDLISSDGVQITLPTGSTTITFTSTGPSCYSSVTLNIASIPNCTFTTGSAVWQSV